MNFDFDMIIKIAAGMIVLFEFGKWIVSFGDPIVELKKRVDAHDKLFSVDKGHLDRIDKAVTQIDEGVSIMGRAISEMMKHEITGNDIDALKSQQSKVNDYFFDRRKSDEN